MKGTFRDRAEAGRLLASKLRTFADSRSAVVLALPRGGVAVGYELARKLRLPLDVLTVRKLGVPGQEELAMGAIASGGVEFLDSAIITALRISAAEIAAVCAREQIELARREQIYRGNRPTPHLEDKTTILVDDGIATGSTMRAAVHTIKLMRPRDIVVATPVASAEAVEALSNEVASVVTFLTVSHLFAIGEYYRDFRQLNDDEVRSLLARGHLVDGKPAAA